MKLTKGQWILTAVSLAAVVIIITVSAILICRDIGMLKSECELYFANMAETSLASEIREVKYSDPKRLPENLMIQLLKGPENSKLYRLIDKETKLLGLYNNDGAVEVDLSDEFLDEDSAKNMLAVYSVVKSLCSIDGVNSVKVTVRGREIETSSGIIGYLSAEDINLSTDQNTIETNEIILYFPEKDTGMLKKKIRTVKVGDQQPLEYYVVSGLIKGPGTKEFQSVLHKDTEIISVNTVSDICFVNMSKNFVEKNAGSNGELAIYSIVNSLTELENINRVQFLIEGKKVHEFGNMDIFGIYERNNDIIG